MSVCDTVTTTIEYADTILTNAGYQGPGTTKASTGQAKAYAVQLTYWITTTTMGVSDMKEVLHMLMLPTGETIENLSLLPLETSEKDIKERHHNFMLDR